MLVYTIVLLCVVSANCNSTNLKNDNIGYCSASGEERTFDDGIPYQSSKQENSFLDYCILSENDFIVMNDSDENDINEDWDEDVQDHSWEGDEDEYEDEDWEEDEESWKEDEDWDNENWLTWDRDRFYEYFNCTEVFSAERPAPDEATWMLLRRTYETAVKDKGKSTISPLSTEHGFKVKVRVAQSPGKGRGVFTDQFIPKNTLVFSSRQTARFPDAESYREMLMALPAEFACDVLVWTFLQDLSNNDDEELVTLSVDLDIGALVNGGETRRRRNIQAGLELANIGCIPEAAENLPGGCKLNDFALVDIQPGEELLNDYTEFTNQQWDEFGLQCNSGRC